jgi:3-hydroxymyristoyl/3-hydroxydecanoyl-(acyl carrier protein) dehydratase
MTTVTHITELLPQRPPFVMIDEILEADEKISRGRFEIREGHLFVEGGYFTVPGIVLHKLPEQVPVINLEWQVSLLRWDILVLLKT